MARRPGVLVHAAMGRIGGGELLLILAIALLIFGPSKLADMGKGLGEGLKNFKKGLSHNDVEGEPKPDEAPAAAPEPPKALPAGVVPPAEVASTTGAGETSVTTAAKPGE